MAIYLLGKVNYFEQTITKKRGRFAALTRSHINGLIPFERTIEQTTETMSLALKQ